jgi:hypothetical protein
MIQHFKVVFVCLGVNQKIINVDDGVGDVVKNLFHQALETGWASKEPHRRRDPLVLTLARLVKAVSGCDASCICQKPNMRSIIEKWYNFHYQCHQGIM